MAGDAKKLQPIIVKKVKKGGHGAHGGAWKIAYADFVTAMMAFFLLMWLLGSTTEGDKKGLQDYFQSPLKLSLLGGGSGAGDASSVIKGGGTDLTHTHGQVRKGDIEAEKKTFNLQALKATQAQAEQERLHALKQRMQNVIDASPQLRSLKSQVRLDMTRDGLRIQIVDDQKRPMFDSGSDMVKPYMRDVLQAIGSVLSEVPNRLTLEGHTDAKPFSAGVAGYSNWELSSDRANASRRELVAGGLDNDRILRVQGLASSIPFNKQDPLDPVNRRISLIVMTRDAEERFFSSTDAAQPAEEGAAPDSASSSPASAGR
ncbi:MAG: flagellar motor protein MotB [Sphaerotilus natans subsp. sulfidivorans]|uniref:flagellar motor protein MotB n=1 Tax=Sphaerotilus sulfidivorans TaxID=639200 RepID=UPI002357D0C2|nr:flagellar motor protein MotB [Sphaerotilus sulfidivorans]MCK6403130.1 flagellar motor protein MotB [Sphaerotilus sulfidivorans]